MSEDREDSARPAEGGTPLLKLLKRVLIGVVGDLFLVAVEFGGPFDLLGIPLTSIWEQLLAIVAGGVTFGVVLGGAWYWAEGGDRFWEFCVFCLAGGAAGQQRRSWWRRMFGSWKGRRVGQEAVRMMRTIKQLNSDVTDVGAS